MAGTGATTLCVAQYDGDLDWHASKVVALAVDLDGSITLGPMCHIICVCCLLRDQGIDLVRVFPCQDRIGCIINHSRPGGVR